MGCADSKKQCCPLCTLLLSIVMTGVYCEVGIRTRHAAMCEPCTSTVICHGREPGVMGCAMASPQTWPGTPASVSSTASHQAVRGHASPLVRSPSMMLVELQVMGGMLVIARATPTARVPTQVHPGWCRRVYIMDLG
jgi:hypothetical protein